MNDCGQVYINSIHLSWYNKSMKNTVIGIILGILILGGVWLFVDMQNQKANQKDEASLNLTLPLGDTNGR